MPSTKVWGLLLLLKLIHTCIQQWCIKLIKSDRKEQFLFQIYAVFFSCFHCRILKRKHITVFAKIVSIKTVFNIDNK